MLLRKVREVLVTCSLSNTEGRAKIATKVVKLIRSQPRGNSLITGIRKLLSRAFALTFKSIEVVILRFNSLAAANQAIDLGVL